MSHIHDGPFPLLSGRKTDRNGSLTGDCRRAGRPTEVMFGCVSFLHFGKLHFWLSTPLAKMLKISVTEVYCSAMFIIQWNLHSQLPFLLNLAATYAHIRQVGRAALPVIVPNKATAELEYGTDVTVPTLTGPVPGPLWPVHSLTVHPSSIPICGRSAGVWLSRIALNGSKF